MAQDFYQQAALTRANQIEMELAAAKADLLVHRQNSDLESAGASVQQIANLEAERANLNSLYQGYVASQQPAPQREISPEERLARRPEHMDWSDVVELARTSRHAKDIKADDPNLVAGWREAMQRKSRGL